MGTQGSSSTLIDTVATQLPIARLERMPPTGRLHQECTHLLQRLPARSSRARLPEQLCTRLRPPPWRVRAAAARRRRRTGAPSARAQRTTRRLQVRRLSRASPRAREAPARAPLVACLEHAAWSGHQHAGRARSAAGPPKWVALIMRRGTGRRQADRERARGERGWPVGGRRESASAHEVSVQLGQAHADVRKLAVPRHGAV